MSKEMWIDAYEELVMEYLDEHPEATEAEAEAYAEKHADDRLSNNIADMIDRARDMAKYQGM